MLENISFCLNSAHRSDKQCVKKDGTIAMTSLGSIATIFICAVACEFFEIPNITLMTSRVQATLLETATTSLRKVPSSVQMSTMAGVYAHSQQKRSFSSAYSFRQGTDNTAPNTSLADLCQMQKLLVTFLIRKSPYDYCHSNHELICNEHK
uniref:Uncharacterized protein n=1 Tax=Onchocerca volvulus TaxID=6282 RepID=A0A8R1TZ59_ONCVO